jgi:hypothetical protein
MVVKFHPVIIFGNDLSQIIKNETQCVELIKNSYKNSLKNQLIKIDSNNDYLNSIKNTFNGELYKYNKEMFVLFEFEDKLILKNIENEKEYSISKDNEIELALEYFKKII